MTKSAQSKPSKRNSQAPVLPSKSAPEKANSGPPQGANNSELGTRNSELFPPTAGSSAAFSLGPVATAQQLSPLTGLTDAALRALQLKRDATGKEYFPKPVRAKWDTVATLRGIIRYHRENPELGTRNSERLPKQCGSMKDVQAVYGIPVEMQKYFREHGHCPDAFDASNRVNVIPLIKGAAPLLAKIFGGGGLQIKGLEGFEELDSDFQLARVRKEDADERARENALANGEIHKKEQIEEIIWESGLAPLRAEYLRIHKLYRQQKKTNPRIAETIMEQEYPKLLEKIRQALPRKQQVAAPHLEERKRAA